MPQNVQGYVDQAACCDQERQVLGPLSAPADEGLSVCSEGEERANGDACPFDLSFDSHIQTRTVQSVAC